MKQVHEHIFENETVVLDGNSFTNCTFNNCTLLITSGYFNFSNNSINNCKLEFDGPATGVLNILELFYPGKLPYNNERPNPGGGKQIF